MAPSAMFPLPYRIGLACLFASFLIAMVSAVFLCPMPETNQRQICPISTGEHLPFEERINMIRPLIVRSDAVYLNWAEKALFTDEQIAAFDSELTANLYGNTHSESTSSERSMDVVDDLRKYITGFLGSSLAAHVVVFTHSQAQALKTVIEAFPFTSGSKFVYSLSSSDDLIGLRGIATEAGATAEAFSEIPKPESFAAGTSNVVAFPLVDAFDGTVMSEEDMATLAGLNGSAPGNVVTVVDATEFIPGGKLDLGKFKFDAVVFDCEKLFGFPKLGVVVMKNDLVWSLQKPYFGGGTLVYALTSRSKEKMRLRPSERFEDGSLPFLNIVAADKGFQLLDRLGWKNITEHVNTIMRQVVDGLNSITRGGKKAIQIYGTNHRTIVSFNVLDENGNVKDYREVLKSALNNNIVVSGGCHNVPGTCLKTFHVDEADVVKEMKMPDCGAIRLSIGWATSQVEVTKFLKWVSSLVV